MSGAELAALWAAVLPAMQSEAHVPPPAFASSEWAELAAGKVVRKRSAGSTSGIIGARLLPHVRTSVWLALTSDRMAAGVSDLTEIVLQGEWAQSKVLYQRFDLPAPLTDRHWVIRLGNNQALAEHAGVWERYWSADPSGLAGARAKTDAASFDDSLAVTTNTGNWLLLEAGTQTLAVYQARLSFGGAVPDGVVDLVTGGGMGDMFTAVSKLASNIRTYYGPACTPQPGADGQPIPCMP